MGAELLQTVGVCSSMRQKGQLRPDLIHRVKIQLHSRSSSVFSIWVMSLPQGSVTMEWPHWDTQWASSTASRVITA